MRFQTHRRAIARNLTYANVTSTLALFLVLGGISYAAATLPKNSIGTKQIKKNGVTAVDIRKNAVTGAKIKPSAIIGSDVKNNALSGDDINESTFGVVPSATTAGTAADRFAALQRVMVSAVNNDPTVARAAAAEVPIASHGQVTVYGKCFKEGDIDQVTGELIVRTTASGSLTAGYSQSDAVNGNPSLKPATAEIDRQLAVATANAGTSAVGSASGSSTIGADGRGFLLDTVIYTLNGPLADSGLAFPAEESCIFHARGSKAG